MIEGNLLLESETFRLPSEELSLFSRRFDSIIKTIALCRKNKDIIYGKGDLCEVLFLEKPFHSYYSPLAFAEIAAHIPDFTRDQFQFLMYELLKYDADILEGCKSFNELKHQFVAANNGIIGLECDRFNCDDDFAVYDYESWHKWKIAYLTKYPQRIDWSKTSHPYLPNLSFSNTLLEKESRKLSGEATCRKFYDYAGKMAGGSKNALAIEVGDKIAKSNFYQYDDAVSKDNQDDNHLRNIYVIEKQGRSLYLSIDVEKASFEVCDHEGRHKGEYLFDGTKHQDADKSGKHDIKLP